MFLHFCAFAQFGNSTRNQGDNRSFNSLTNPSTNLSDTSKREVTRSNRNKIIKLKLSANNFYGQTRYSDTSINNLHAKWNLPFYQQSLGNVNSAVYSLKFKPYMHATQVLGNFNYNSYNNNIDSVLFYNTSNPYTVMQYNGGNKRENGIQILHTQNINPLNNFSFSYSKYGGPGFFNLQRSVRDNAHVAMQFRPHPKSRYSGQYAIVYNKNQQDENGGIANEADLEDPTWAQRNTLPVNYTSSNLRATASATKNVYRQLQMHLKNLYALSFASTAQDSVFKIPNLQAFYALKINAEKQTFSDRDPINSKYAFLTDSVFKSYDTIIAINKVNTIRN